MVDLPMVKCEICKAEIQMLKELSIAVMLTILFSIGVGVLFVRTIIEMIEMFFNGEIERKEPLHNRESK